MNEWNKWTNGIISIIIILLFIYLVKQVIVYKGSEIYTDVEHPPPVLFLLIFAFKFFFFILR